MEANDFIVRFKANGTEKDLCDLRQVCDDYKLILSNLGAKDKGAFALNVLCILCRNLDKVPTWKDRVDGRTLVVLTVECVHETRGLPRTDQVKVLACIYHIQKHVIKMTSSIPPELVLKLSFMTFEWDVESMLVEYCKTYWNILVDRIAYIERLKSKTSISKLLPKTLEDILKVLQIYDSVQFCTNILTFLIKKLHFLYNDTNTKELQQSFGEIFKVLSSKTDLVSFKKLKPKELLDVYVKFNECFYVIAENASRAKFENCLLNVVVRTAITVLGHNYEIMRCLETFYLNGFCSIFDNQTNPLTIENVLNNMVVSCTDLEKLGYEKTMHTTYSFLNQFLRVYLEFTVSNKKLDWNSYFNETMQISCLNLMLHLSSRKSEQFLKCDNCTVKSSLHDSLRLLFLIKHFPVASISQKLDITNLLPVYYKLVNVQHKILYELKRLGCANHQKCFTKLQTDIHNTAIALNKANYYEYSIKLFKLYIEFEIHSLKDANELRNISRALYNKSICELDNKLFYEALKDAYLSLIFSLPEGLGSEKCMSLVMDIKAKSLKSNQGEDEIQLASAFEICKKCLDEKLYGNLKPFFVNVKFSEVLQHEFKMYAKLWPSIVPIAGVWASLYDLLKEDQNWIDGTENSRWTLFEVMFETVTIVWGISLHLTELRPQ
ncbi:hypothetical protein evm_004590 [Chilo suppressalis]|nr:hypothetical protein evm_004590 [Chilo suppressalis]